MENDNQAPASARLKPSELPPLRRVTIADVRKVEALVRARRTSGS